MVHTSAGHTTNNKIWNNGIDVEYDNSQYDYFLGNRVTQAQKQGFICNTCSFITHTENQYYANSAAGAGTYADAQLLTTTLSTFANDKFYDWNAVNSTNYNLTADSNSFNDVMTGETFSYYTTQPTNIDSAVWTSWNARSNVPSGSAYTNNDQVSALVSVVTSSVGGTGSTPYYFGAQGTNSATETSTSGFINQSPVVLHCFRIQTTVTPTGGGTYTWTVRNNDAGTSMTLTQTAGVYVVGSCFSQANSVSVAVGNPIDVQLVSAAGGGTAPATGANITISAGN